VPDLKGDSKIHFIPVKGRAKNKPYSYWWPILYCRLEV